MTAGTTVVRLAIVAEKSLRGSAVPNQLIETGLTVFQNKVINVFICKRMGSGFQDFAEQPHHIDTFAKTVH